MNFKLNFLKLSKNITDKSSRSFIYWNIIIINVVVFWCQLLKKKINKTKKNLLWKMIDLSSIFGSNTFSAIDAWCSVCINTRGGFQLTASQGMSTSKTTKKLVSIFFIVLNKIIFIYFHSIYENILLHYKMFIITL
mgnify:FL=1